MELQLEKAEDTWVHVDLNIDFIEDESEWVIVDLSQKTTFQEEYIDFPLDKTGNPAILYKHLKFSPNINPELRVDFREYLDWFSENHYKASYHKHVGLFEEDDDIFPFLSDEFKIKYSDICMFDENLFVVGKIRAVQTYETNFTPIVIKYCYEIIKIHMQEELIDFEFITETSKRNQIYQHEMYEKEKKNEKERLVEIQRKKQANTLKDITISENYNQPLEPMTYLERLAVVDQYVKPTNRTKKELRNFLIHVTKLHHGIHSGLRFTKERKVRWFKHAKWITSSPALGPVIDGGNTSMVVFKKQETPKYVTPEQIFEIKTIISVDYKEGYIEENEIIKTPERTEVEKIDLIPEGWKMLHWERGNKVIIQNEDSGYKKTISLPIAKNMEDRFISRQIEDNHGYESTRWYSKFKYVSKKIEAIKESIKIVHEPQVKFEEKEYTIPVQSTEVIPKKTHDLEWRKVVRKSVLQSVLENRNALVDMNRFAVLNSSKKLTNMYKNLDLGFTNVREKVSIYDMKKTIKNSFQNKKKKTKKSQIVKTEMKKFPLADLVEAKLSEHLMNRLKNKYPQRMRFISKHIHCSYDNLIKFLEKGFLNKKEFKYKKFIRAELYNIIDSYNMNSDLAYAPKSIYNTTGVYNYHSDAYGDSSSSMSFDDD